MCFMIEQHDLFGHVFRVHLVEMVVFHFKEHILQCSPIPEWEDQC